MLMGSRPADGCRPSVLAPSRALEGTVGPDWPVDALPLSFVGPQGGRQALGPSRLSKLGLVPVLAPFSVGMGPFEGLDLARSF